MQVGKILGFLKIAGRKVKIKCNKQICNSYKNSSIFRTVIKPFKPIRDTSRTYRQNKSLGKVQALKETIKKNGIGGPAGAILGAGAGFTSILLPGGTEIGALGGWYLGRGIELGSKYTAKLAKNAVSKTASIFTK